MPKKPKRGCAFGWCPRLAVEGEKYCEKHLKQETRKYERFGRDKNTKKMYKGNWPKIRARFVKENPYCTECLKAGLLTPTEHVHHIKPLSEGGTHEKSNLMALCKSCHSRIHSQRGDRWGRPHEYKF